MIKRILSVIFVFAMAFPFAACDGKKTENAEIAVWTASGTEKIMRNIDYSDRHDEDTLAFEVFRNEYESGQIIVTSVKGDADYTVETADLTSADGAVLPKSSFELFNQKYLNVTQLVDLSVSTPIGWYPDALIPFDVAAAHGENRVTEGENRGIWVSVKPDKEQKAGVYEGQFTVKAAGKEVAVPVSVTVYDYTLSDTVHTKSSFMVNIDEIARAELDSTEQMQVKYYDFLLDYRINAQNLPGNDMYDFRIEGDSLEKFLDYAEKYSRDERVSTYNLPFSTQPIGYTNEKGVYKTITSVQFDQFETILRAMAARSVEKKVDLFEKAGTYFIFFDEYDLNGVADDANYNLKTAVELCENLSRELADTLECDDAAFKAKMLNSLAGIKHKVVGNLTDSLTATKALCVPTIDKYNLESVRQKYIDFDRTAYGEDGELWTYTCCLPLAPYPTYHIEDALLSSRLLYWMMYRYNIVGNLYWDAAMYAYRTSQFGNLHLQDYYGELAMRYPEANGDGFLMYPGRQYGIDGPVASIRLHSLRDGNEDWEIMYALEQIYRERGVSEQNFDDMLAGIHDTLYSGTRVRYRDNLNDIFDEGRKSLASLMTAAASTGTVVESLIIADGKATAVISAPEGATVKVNGSPLSCESSGGVVRGTVEIGLDNASNYLDAVTEFGGKTSRIGLSLGGRSIIRYGKDLVGSVTFSTGGEAVEETIDDIASARLNYSAVTEGDRVSATVDVSSLNVTAESSSVTVRLYLYGSAAREVDILGKCGNNLFDSAKKVTLAPGWNEIEIPATSLTVRQARLDFLRFNLMGPEEASLAIGSIAVKG